MKLTCIVIIFLFIGCSPKNEKLETALKLAGKNRPELEQVLLHYSQKPADTLKLKAAEFLIENMPGHYTLDGELIREYRKRIFADSIGSYFAKKALDISLSLVDELRNASEKKEDVKYIKSDFLIRHIDLSFELLQNYSWLKDIPFDLFLEHILPYRFENEELDLWRDSLHISADALAELRYMDDVKHSISNVHTRLNFEKRPTNVSTKLINDVFGTDIYSDCHHISLREMFRYQAFVLPSVLTFIPHYPNRNGYHYWTFNISPERNNTDVINAYERKAAKIYQRTYSINEIITPFENEYIPDLFKEPFNKDVTDLYVNTTNVIVKPFHKPANTLYHAYLCVLNDLTWKPIAIGSLSKGKVEFRNMGKDIVYLPSYYEKQKMHALNYPFILNLKGETKYLIPDTNHRKTIRFIRKYPFKGNQFNYIKKLKNIKIEASNNTSSEKSDSIISLYTSDGMYFSQQTNTSKQYRFWHLIHSEAIQDIAELEFIDPKGQILKGKTDPTYIYAFDKDPLTNIGFSRNNEITIDFGVPVEISRIVCIPRGDGNGIYPGNEYDLRYYNLNGWQSLGRKIATDYYIEYENVPEGALLWLRNLTTGIEERIFTHENDEIRFW